MNGRFFAKRQLVAEWYDGVTNYKIRETEDDHKRRLDAFGDWLENQSSSDDEEGEAPAE
jgi:HIV Tat-specific factor 1